MLGTNLEKYPVDLGVYSNYSRSFDNSVGGNFPLLPSLKVSEALELLKKSEEKKISIV